MIRLGVNGRDHALAVDGAVPLLQVLRNELREPLREARASLALAEGRGDLGHEMIVLLDRVGELLQGLDRLLELSLL